MTDSPALRVELRRSGTTVTVLPAHTVLEALENQGIEVASLCRAGLCGSCEVTVLGAEFESTEPPEAIVSRPGGCAIRLCVATTGTLTRLVLDL
ncbi:2Fe-2S iron-sulfur cluster binding domain-containing protein [Nocardia otitidiscaviarum]|uniref:2Fe-2S ferredoxin YfaE n=1 Tax=Nocardia otitidiscaviarum TaxID=1823 RepID=A0A379JI57_9NOCA|nr:2Fe-2S iron-sulfur cluster binding domain-containing protein [Nocardia otitidiscaviarum]MBF6132347.1 2Fe-2S iron-sulfur cluster binding domain-containing protein [Nocardia otitidiscaviarum]MBF6483439.1 2Fe-2S iron-sulfur cluster binding domain-containing protein [Nocardia otitidiscaviarum]SUD47693.1 2Fe-2S ferredoxin YfaE [Nocardia otitidiscaviarum]